MIYSLYFVNLQLFADAGDVVTTTTGYVNAYTGATVDPNPATNTMSPTMKTFYDTELLENARAKLVFNQLGKKQALPKNHGKTVEWRKFNTFAPSLEPLVEGVIPAGKQFGMTNITVAVDQHGDYTTISDVLEMHAVDPIILGATEEMGAAGGETADILTRNELLGGTNVQYADKIYNNTVTPVTSRAGLDGYCKLTPTEVNKAVTMLKKQKAQPFEGGKYVAVVHPSVAFDLRQCDEWIEAHKYAATTQIFNGEIGELHGCRFIETTNSPILKGEDLAAAGRNLTVASNASASATTISVSETLVAHEVKGRTISLGGHLYTVSDNTTNALTITPGLAANVSASAVIYPGEGLGDGGALYCVLFFGKDAFGVVDPAGMGMEMIIKARSEVGGPLEQFSTVGYKFETAAKILYEERMVRVECGSAYSAIDDAN